MTRDGAIPPELRRGLRNYWYPVMLGEDLPADRPVGIMRLGESLVAWRDGDGVARVFVDRCPHRGARLSIGDVVDGRLQCRYHGLQYDGTGQCRLVPVERVLDGRQAQRICASTYPTEERAGLVWAYLGDVDAFPPPPLEMMPEMSDDGYASLVYESIWNANWLIIHDNTSDPAHVPFLHGHFISRMNGGDLELEKLPDGNPLVTPEGFGVLVADDLVATTTENQVLVTRKVADAPDADHSATFDEVLFTLPAVGSVWVPVPDGGPPVRLHQYELPIDDQRTVVYAWAGRAVPPEAADETRAVLESFFVPATNAVFNDDSWITENQPDVEEAWASEQLLSFDVGPPRVRRLILSAYEQQQRRLAELGSAASPAR